MVAHLGAHWHLPHQPITWLNVSSDTRTVEPEHELGPDLQGRFLAGTQHGRSPKGPHSRHTCWVAADLRGKPNPINGQNRRLLWPYTPPAVPLAESARGALSDDSD